MACNNAVMIRYQVKISPGQCNLATDFATQIAANTTNNNVQTITKVNGLDLGEEGTIEVPDWEVKATISDGKRTLPQLEMQYRVDADLRAFNLFTWMFQNRAALTADIQIFICKRDWSVLYSYKYLDCQLRKHGQEGQELGQTKLGLIDTMFSPYDVQLLDASGNLIVYQVPKVLP
jgi:activator of HSP90 ATPase